MAQTATRVRLPRRGQDLEEPGKREPTIPRGARVSSTGTSSTQFIAKETAENHDLVWIVVACLPNGRAQHRYNPTATDTIWSAGQDAPPLGETFRVRLSSEDLHRKSARRVYPLEPSPSVRESAVWALWDIIPKGKGLGLLC